MLPYFYKERPNQIVLEGELDFDKTEHPKEIYNKLRRVAEEIGAFVTTSGIRHGGEIRVYPAYSSSYYVLNMYLEDPNDIKSKLRITHIVTFSKTDVMRLVD